MREATSVARITRPDRNQLGLATLSLHRFDCGVASAFRRSEFADDSLYRFGMKKGFACHAPWKDSLFLCGYFLINH